MFKKIVLISVAVLLLAYLLVAIFFLNPGAGGGVCKDLEILIVDTLDQHYLDSKDIAVMLKNAGMSPIGKELSEIRTDAIEKKLEENKLIKRAECYKTSGGSLKIEVYQKIPVLRIISNNGNYYVDNDGETMPVPNNFASYVPVVTGYVEKEFAQSKLYEFALFLQENKFWNTQIEQIYVTPNQDIELIPRVGNHQIILGKIDDYRENLEKLRLFYDKGLNEVGWNRYSIINLKYKNQVVCTKK